LKNKKTNKKLRREKNNDIELRVNKRVTDTDE
jgi:hypothetical protein